MSARGSEGRRAEDDTGTREESGSLNLTDGRSFSLLAYASHALSTVLSRVDVDAVLLSSLRVD